MSQTTHIKVYQADIDRPFVFQGYDFIKGIFPDRIPLEHYRQVYESDYAIPMSSDEDLLDYVFELLNRGDRPGRDKFRSMSVSDIVEITDVTDGQYTNPRHYYVDTFGFAAVQVST